MCRTLAMALSFKFSSRAQRQTGHELQGAQSQAPPYVPAASHPGYEREISSQKNLIVFGNYSAAFQLARNKGKAKTLPHQIVCKLLYVAYAELGWFFDC